jgi:hypothetical protein
MKPIQIGKIMELFITITYVVLIVATLLVRRALKMRDHQSARQFNVRSSARLHGTHHY